MKNRKREDLFDRASELERRASRDGVLDPEALDQMRVPELRRLRELILRFKLQDPASDDPGHRGHRPGREVCGCSLCCVPADPLNGDEIAELRRLARKAGADV